MAVLKSTLLICITVLLSISVYFINDYYNKRLIVVPAPNSHGIFIVNMKKLRVDYCSTEKCHVVPLNYNIPNLPGLSQDSGAGMNIPTQDMTQAAPQPMMPVDQQGMMAAQAPVPAQATADQQAALMAQQQAQQQPMMDPNQQMGGQPAAPQMMAPGQPVQ